jgi:DNA-nicking Smr family endonuclease
VKRVPLEDSFDLHSFRPEDVASVVEEYLREARAAGLSEVRLIHGKGIGLRRAEVRQLLAGRPDVADFFDAPPERGGSGATVVVLVPETLDSRL